MGMEGFSDFRGSSNGGIGGTIDDYSVSSTCHHPGAVKQK